MSEPDNNTQRQERRIRELVMASLVMVVVWLCTWFLMYVFWFPGYAGHELVIGVLFGLRLVSLPAAFVLGIVALVRIKISNGRLVGRGLVMLGIGVTVAPVILWCLSIGLRYRHSRKLLQGMCWPSLRELGVAMSVYAHDNDRRYPTPERWCDLLVQGDYVTESQFLCVGALTNRDEGPAHYAINPSTEPNSPPDIVLLFETEGGWNQFGGPEILITEHHGGKGCNILFNDGSVEFVKLKKLKELKWK